MCYNEALQLFPEHKKAIEAICCSNIQLTCVCMGGLLLAMLVATI